MSDEINLATGWTLPAYVAHNEALRDAGKRFDDERDRRYAELAIEREKALKIKETADLAALGLAREIQTYKDEKANELREQIANERGSYATKEDLVAAVLKLEAQMKPFADYVTAQQGGPRAITGNTIAAVLAAIVAAIALWTWAQPDPVVVTPTEPVPTETTP